MEAVGTLTGPKVTVQDRTVFGAWGKVPLKILIEVQDCAESLPGETIMVNLPIYGDTFFTKSLPESDISLCPAGEHVGFIKPPGHASGIFF